jgi:hypothetical protein
MKFLSAVLLVVSVTAHADPVRAASIPTEAPHSGAAALADWRVDAFGITRKITADMLPASFVSRSSSQTVIWRVAYRGQP